MLAKVCKSNINFLLLLLCFTACQEDCTQSYYYWRSAYNLDKTEQNALLNCQSLYLKVCDVIKVGNKAEPIAVTIWKDKPINSISYIPVVYIDKDVFVNNYTISDNIDTARWGRLAKNVYRMISTSWAYNQLSFDEIQIDCDWTAMSKKRYFVFLSELKKVSNKKLTATIRLDQVKNYNSTGVPPVDEGVIMAYNMGNLKRVDATNSILSMDVLKQYIDRNTDYPLPSKLALPIFSWKLVYHENKFRGILRSYPDSLLEKNFVPEGQTVFRCNKAHKYADKQVVINDLIRVEKTTKKENKKAERYIRNCMSLLNETIFFDLSTDNLKQHE